jgi:hypothetical protein
MSSSPTGNLGKVFQAKKFMEGESFYGFQRLFTGQQLSLPKREANLNQGPKRFSPL